MGVCVKPFAGMYCTKHMPEISRFLHICTLLFCLKKRKKRLLNPPISRAAMSGVVGYSLKGIDAEFSKGVTARIFEPVLSARVAQGELEYLHASEDEKKEIIQMWFSHLAQRQEQEVEKNMRGKGKGKERASGEDL